MTTNDKTKDTKKEIVVKTNKDQLSMPVITADGALHIQQWCAESTDKPFMKYVKGEYLFGVEAEVMPLGTNLVPDMRNLSIGQIKWGDDGEVVEQRSGLVHDGAAVRRADVGDHDEEMWPRDENGRRSDPWNPIRTLPMKNPATGAEYVFTTSSRGGNDALIRLCSQWARQRRDNINKLPVIEIGTSSYKHPKYGKVHKPVFILIGWETPENLRAGVESTTAEALNDSIPEQMGVGA